MKTIASLEDKKQLSAMVAELQSNYAVGHVLSAGRAAGPEGFEPADCEYGDRAASRCLTARTISTTVREARSCGISMSSM